MNKISILLLALFICIMPLTLADDVTIVGQQTQLWADIFDGANYYSASSANITIYYPNGTIVVNNASMFFVNQGRYGYNFTPNTTGIHYTFTEFRNTTSLVGIGSSSFYVAPADINNGGSGMSGIGVIIALGIGLAIFAYMAFAFKSEDNRTNSVWKILSLIVVILLLVLLSWGAIDANKICSLTYDSASPDGYSLVCKDGPMNQGTMFLRLMLLILVVFFIWISVSLFISSMEYLRSTGKI